MPLTKEQLLQDRIKVIADYPDNPWDVGDILYPFDGATQQIIGFPDFKKYPHIFQPLPWWSDRKIEDMPEYVYCPSRKMYFKIDKWGIDHFVINGKTKRQYDNYVPATETEYTAYINQKQQ